MQDSPTTPVHGNEPDTTQNLTGNQISRLPSFPEGKRENSLQPTRGEFSSPDMLRSLTRLIIGGISLGYDGLKNRLQAWEEVSAQISSTSTIDASGQATGKVEQQTSGEVEIITIPKEPETEADLLRYAVIGAMFETQEKIGAGLKTLDIATRAASNLADPFLHPVAKSRLLSPFRSRFTRWVDRGQEEVNRWIETGRTEEPQSRALTDAALRGTVDSSIDYLADNKQIQELVTMQSAGLATELVEEVRERTVTVDNLVEDIVRTMLRQPLRKELPEPPQQVKAQATPLWKAKGGVIRKP